MLNLFNIRLTETAANAKISKTNLKNSKTAAKSKTAATNSQMFKC